MSKPSNWRLNDLFIDLQQQSDFVDGEPCKVYVLLRMPDNENVCRACVVGKLTIDGHFSFDLDLESYRNGGEWWYFSDSMEKIELTPKIRQV